jgi:hypothetical protein
MVKRLRVCEATIRARKERVKERRRVGNMNEKSVSQAALRMIAKVKETGDVDRVGEWLKELPITECHAEIADAYDAMARRWGFGHTVDTSACEPYRQHWLRFLAEVRASIMAQAPA